jgi:hypothetical protein
MHVLHSRNFSLLYFKIRLTIPHKLQLNVLINGLLNVFITEQWLGMHRNFLFCFRIIIHVITEFIIHIQSFRKSLNYTRTVSQESRVIHKQRLIH